jgi:cytidyltransferase-like protein
MDNKIVLVTGGFDPIHSGHIEYFKEASKLGSKLIVGVNSDEWLVRKKGSPFMPIEERMAIIQELRCVDEVIVFDDTDNTAKDAIIKCLDMYPDNTIVFANGGDRGKDNIPEMDLSDIRLSFAFGVGGNDKKNSSSWILANYASMVK